MLNVMEYVEFYGNEAVFSMGTFEYFGILREGRDNLENNRSGRW
jgi:hypothetical protein